MAVAARRLGTQSVLAIVDGESLATGSRTAKEELQMRQGLGAPFSIRVAAEEKEALKVVSAERFGSPRKEARLIRRYIAEGLARDQGQELPNFEAQQALIDSLGKLRSDLARVGGNLNQIAHAANMHDTVNGRSLADVHGELRDLFAELMALLREVSNGLHDRRAG